MLRSLLGIVAVLLATPAMAADLPALKVLFLGDNAGHAPKARFDQLAPVMSAQGITLTYTMKASDLNDTNLAGYDALLLYANIDGIKPEEEKALFKFVEQGKGFVPVHCASYCFRNSEKFVELVGAQFRSHTTGVFRTTLAKVEHPIIANYQPFSSWDETYVHHKHNEKDRIVLEYRNDGGISEPWTWVRTHGKGRIFYTAWGHDQRTWSHEGFHALIERGIRWSCGQDVAKLPAYFDKPELTTLRKDVAPFEYVPAKVPFYPASKQWGVQNEPIGKMQKPLKAEESVKHYQTPVGFEVKTFVTEEQLGGKPICMTWDERGRLWLGLSLDYPNELQPEGQGRDRIVVCEDTNGDGVCDKVTTFADKLSIPTSIIPAFGGLIVHQAPHTLFLKDTNGDGKADVRQILFTGWGTRDTHAGPSNLRYGPDGWFYGMSGYSGFVGTVAGESVRFGQGLYRFQVVKDNDKLKVTKLEFLRSTNNNSWGVSFNENGELFGSTANGCPLVHLTIPNRYFEKIRGLTPSALPNIASDNHYEPITDKVRAVDWHGGFTAGAGCAIYTARTYPQEYWNRTAFVSDPTGHLTATFVLKPNGATYAARYGWNLVASDDEWASPIDAQVGPDGNMWVVDWYAFIVQHNPTPQGFKTGKGNAYETELRDKTHGRVYRVVYTKAKPEPKMDLGNANKEQLLAALKHHNLTWRFHAQRLLTEKGEFVSQTSDFNLDKLANGTPGEMLRELLKIADQPDAANAASVLVTTLQGTKVLSDPTLKQGLTIAAAVHSAEFLNALAKSNVKVDKDVSDVVTMVAKHYASGSPEATVGKLLKSLSESKSPAVTDAIVAGLTAGWRTSAKATLNAEEEQALGTILTSASNSSRGRLLKLASSWGLKGFETQLATLAKGILTTVGDATASDTDRIEAAKQAQEISPSDEVTAMAILNAVSGANPVLATGLLESLAQSRVASIGSVTVSKLKEFAPTVRPVALRLILARPASARAFLDAVEKGDLRFDMLALDQKTALATHPDKALAERAKKLLALGGGLPDPNRQKVIEALSPVLLKATGDAKAGKAMFTKHCAKCHKHGEEGQVIGPDLTGMAVHPKEELIVHVLDPSRSVEGNYKAYTARLLDGRVITGLLASETKTSVELLDAENKRHAISRDNLDSLVDSPKSLMPEGFEKDMTPVDLTNLLAFMTQKGKYVPIPLDKTATVVSTKGMFNSESSQAESLIFNDWKPKTFNSIPFQLIDPQGDKVKNVILLNGPNGTIPPKMPTSVTLPCNTPAKAIHFLSGVSGWGSPGGERNSVTMIVKLTYADGKSERHDWKNGVHFADYIRRVDVPQSEFAFAAKGRQQVRYLAINPKRPDEIKTIELIKGTDKTAPLVVAVTIETP